MRHTIFISYSYSLYTGDPNILDIQFELMTPFNAETPVFTLTCTSIGGPATTVTWTRNGLATINSSVSQTVVDPLVANYSNQLTVTGSLAGMYTCTITTNLGGGDISTLQVESKES